MDKKCNDLMKEVKLFQESLADYNTVLDKVGRAAPHAAVVVPLKHTKLPRGLHKESLYTPMPPFSFIWPPLLPLHPSDSLPLSHPFHISTLPPQLAFPKPLSTPPCPRLPLPAPLTPLR